MARYWFKCEYIATVSGVAEISVEAPSVEIARTLVETYKYQLEEAKDYCYESMELEMDTLELTSVNEH